MPGPSYPGMRAPLVPSLRWRPDLLDHLRARHGIRRVPRHTVAIRRHPAPALVWADGIAGQPPSECLGDLAGDADRRADDLFARLLVSNLAVVPVRRVGVIRTLLDGGHFRYPARAWAEARPILALACLVAGLLASVTGMVAGVALLFAGVYWLFTGVTR